LNFFSNRSIRPLCFLSWHADSAVKMEALKVHKMEKATIMINASEKELIEH